MESTVLLWVAMRFVTGVHDGPLQRCLETNLFLEEVGALTDLVGHRTGIGARKFAAHFAGAAEHLP